MAEFNRMTIVAATEVIAYFKTHNDMELLEVQWDISGRCSSSSRSGRSAALARIAIEEDIKVLTEKGETDLARAIVELAADAPPRWHDTPEWKKFLAGLRFDGFEIKLPRKVSLFDMDSDHVPFEDQSIGLVRMLPSDIPGLDFREAQNEVEELLQRHGFSVPSGHLKRALQAFQLGNWSSSNGELRNVCEGYLSEIAAKLGYTGGGDAKSEREYLGANVTPPFLLEYYNEWHANNQKPQYVQGLMSRMHPHGAHPGLSEEEDATFRLQITLITARLFLRRFDQR